MTLRICTNSQVGTFNHECGAPAVWVGAHRSGHRQAFCEQCRRHGHEAAGVVTWEHVPATETVTLGGQSVAQGLIPGVAAVSQAARDIAALQARRATRRGCAPCPDGGLFDAVARAQEELF